MFFIKRLCLGAIRGKCARRKARVYFLYWAPNYRLLLAKVQFETSFTL